MNTSTLFSAMKRFPILCVAAALAAMAPAQKLSIEGRIGRAISGSVMVGSDHGHRHSHRHRGHVHVEPVLRAPARHGHWKTVYEEVLVPGYWSDQHVPATYGWIYESCGHRRWGIVAPASCTRVWIPARYETRSRQVWVPC